jgi:methylmalonyl-CoA mutase
VEVANKLFGYQPSIDNLASSEIEDKDRLIKGLTEAFENEKMNLNPHNWESIEKWGETVEKYKNPEFKFKVRDKELSIKTHTESLSHLQIPKISLPKYTSWGDTLRWILQENVPGEFPYTAGLFPFKREGEDPTRMFAGEGGPERTNRRFHYVSMGLPAKRLSTAFD